MNRAQRESTAKYLYDVSKATAVVAIVNNLVKGETEPLNLIFGFVAALAFFIFAYKTEEKIKDE